MSKPLIFCDIDSTINDHWRRIRRNTLPQWPGDRIDKKAFTEPEVAQDKPLPGAVEAVSCLNELGAFSFLSARGWLDARSITEKWLIRYGFQWSELLIVANMRAKLALVEVRRPDVVIDDFMTGQERAIPTFNKDVAEAMQGMGAKLIVFRNDWADVLEQVRLYAGRG